MKYKIGDLIKDYIDNIICRDVCKCNIKLGILNGENIDELVKEKEIYSKKVDVIERLFTLDSNTNKAPIQGNLTENEYKLIKGIYIDRLDINCTKVASKLSMNPNSAGGIKFNAIKKLKKIEVEL